MSNIQSLGIKIKDVADAAGVSPATASKVLTGNGIAHRVSPATIDRVQRAARELGYVPNAAARQLRTRHTGQIGILWHDDHGTVRDFHRMAKALPLSDLYSARGSFDARAIRGNFDGAILAGLTFAAQELGLSGVVIYPKPDPASDAPPQFLDGRTDGLIVRDHLLEHPELTERMVAQSLPVLALWTQEVPEGIGFADTDHAGGSALAVQHLLELGHRRIAFLGGKGNDPHHLRQRHLGYQVALQEARIEPAPEWFVSNPSEVLTLLRGEKPVTAVLTATDLEAAALTTALLEAGVRIPQDLSLVGYDDMPGADFIAGGLTTVYQAVREMAVEAVRNLVKLMRGEEVRLCRTVVPNRLVVRRTTAQPNGPRGQSLRKVQGFQVEQ